MINPLDLRTYTADGPFNEAQVDQNWLDIQGAVNALIPQSMGNLAIERRTSNIELSNADSRKWIQITSGTFEQEFADDLEDDFFCIIQNMGTGQITIPSSDGRTNWIMYPRESRLFKMYDGGLVTLVLTPYQLRSATSGTFTKPPGYAAHSGWVVGAGASGARNTSVGLGGGGGAKAPFWFPDSDIAATAAYTVGTGGASVTAGSANGNNGGDSSFNGVTASGGKGGQTNSSNSAAAHAYIPSNAGALGGANAVFYSAARAFFGGGLSTGSVETAGQFAVHGGAPGGGINGTVAATVPPGESVFSGDGGLNGVESADGQDGQAPGGGGGAYTHSGSGTGKSGAGADGEFFIRGIV